MLRVTELDCAGTPKNSKWKQFELG